MFCRSIVAEFQARKHVFVRLFRNFICLLAEEIWIFSFAKHFCRTVSTSKNICPIKEKKKTVVCMYGILHFFRATVEHLLFENDFLNRACCVLNGSVAERVAWERGEAIGKSVGYVIRLDNAPPRIRGSILYCTTGILLRRLQVRHFHSCQCLGGPYNFTCYGWPRLSC